MCGIFGVIKLKGGVYPENFKENITVLAAESSERGTDATGFAYIKDGNVVSHKKNVSSLKFVQQKEWNNLELPDILIGHTRWATQGKPEDNLNNHPIVGSELVVVHNGHINNDDEVFRDFGFDRSGEVDSEAILRLLEFNTLFDDAEKAIKNTASELEGRFAVAALYTKRPNELFLFRHDNPIVLGYIKELNVIVFASEKKFIENAFSTPVLHAGYFVENKPIYEIMYREMENDSALTIGENGIEEIYSISAKDDWWDRFRSRTRGFERPQTVKVFACPGCGSCDEYEDLKRNGHVCRNCSTNLYDCEDSELSLCDVSLSDWNAINSM